MPNDALGPKWNVFLCDDEPAVLDRLLALCRKAMLPQYNAEFFCSTSPDALPEPGIQLHIAVLDILLEQANGISLARAILERFPDCQIIFVSGYPRYVSDVYDVAHLGMVLKDQLEAQLPKFLLRAADVLSSQKNGTLSVLSNRVPLQIRVSSILYMERKDHTTYIHLASGQTIRTRQKLTELLAQPHGEALCRCHVSYAVNLCRAVGFNGHGFLLGGELQIPVSRVYTQSARNAYYACLQEAVGK